MNKQILSISQMLHLQSLGLKTSKASMCWTTFNGDTMLSVHDEYCYESASLHPIPTFDLQDILERLPKDISRDCCTWYASLYIDFENNKVAYGNTDRYGFEIYHEVCIENELIDAVYEMLCWCIENGYLKVKEE